MVICLFRVAFAIETGAGMVVVEIGAMVEVALAVVAVVVAIVTGVGDAGAAGTAEAEAACAAVAACAAGAYIAVVADSVLFGDQVSATVSDLVSALVGVALGVVVGAVVGAFVVVHCYFPGYFRFQSGNFFLGRLQSLFKSFNA